MPGDKKVSVTKFGEFKLNEYSVLVINKTDYSGEDKIDFRVWKNSPKYKGPTKQGFVLSMDQINDFIKLTNEIKDKLSKGKKTKK